MYNVYIYIYIYICIYAIRSFSCLLEPSTRVSWILSIIQLNIRIIILIRYTNNTNHNTNNTNDSTNNTNHNTNKVHVERVDIL